MTFLLNPFFLRSTLFLAALGSAAFGTTDGPKFDIRDYGAVGDGSTLNTGPIQEALDEAHAAGGGKVLIDGGIYVSGSVRLRSNVTLHMGPAGVLKACGPSEEAFPSYPLLKAAPPDGAERPSIRSLVFAEDAQNIAISGPGIIDGNGLAFPKDGAVRPRVICFVRCRDVIIENVTTEGGASWTQHYVHCSDVQIRNVLVRAYLPDQNNDGIDIEECHRVRLTNSTVIADDDAIVLKSTLTPDHGTRDITVENCVVYGKKSAFKIGTETFGPFEDITVRNLIVYGTRGITLYSVDGGHVRNVSIDNIRIQDGYAAATLRLGNRGRYPMPGTSVSPSPGRISEITIRNVDATLSEKSFQEILRSEGIKTASPADARTMPVLVDFISGIPGHPIEGVALENFVIRNRSKALPTPLAANEVPERIGEYPKTGMFGVLPANGLYLRHVDGIGLSNVKFEVPPGDERPTLVTDDVTGLVTEHVVSNVGFRLLEVER